MQLVCRLSQLYKLFYHTTEVEPRARWAVIFGGLDYMIIYIPRSAAKTTFYVSPRMRFCFKRNEAQPAASGLPPIWSMLVYMLLAETLDIDDDDLNHQLGLPAPSPPLSRDKDLSRSGLNADSTGHNGSRRLEVVHELDERLSRSVKLATVGHPFLFLYLYLWHLQISSGSKGNDRSMLRCPPYGSIIR